MQHRENGGEEGDTGDLVTTAEAARILNVHRVTVWRMVGRGELEPVRMATSAYLFKRADIEAHVP